MGVWEFGVVHRFIGRDWWIEGVHCGVCGFSNDGALRVWILQFHLYSVCTRTNERVTIDKPLVIDRNIR